MFLPSENGFNNNQNIRQVLVDAGVEVLGPRDAEKIFAAVDLSGEAMLPAVYHALKQQYGEPCAQGVGLRMGRATLQYGLRAWGQQAGLGATEFRLQPPPRKVHWMLTALCANLLENFGAPASLSQDAQYWYLRVESCPACRGCSTETLACPILTGLLQEIMAWAGGGRYHSVEEVACCALGAAECRFRIDKKALD